MHLLTLNYLYAYSAFITLINSTCRHFSHILTFCNPCVILYRQHCGCFKKSFNLHPDLCWRYLAWITLSLYNLNKTLLLIRYTAIYNFKSILYNDSGYSAVFTNLRFRKGNASSPITNRIVLVFNRKWFRLELKLFVIRHSKVD